MAAKKFINKGRINFDKISAAIEIKNFICELFTYEISLISTGIKLLIFLIF